MAVEFSTFETEQRAAEALFNEIRHYLGFGPGYHTNGRDENGNTTDKTATAPYVIMLAGGSTPMEVYRNVADHPPRMVHPAAHFLLSDDRFVPEGDSRSNYGTIRPMADKLGLVDGRFVHVNAETGDRAAADFGEQVVDLGRRNALFALGILGIGTDGHTASLFSPELVALPSDDLKGRQIGDGKLLTDDPRRAALETGEHGGVQRISLGAEVLLSFQKLIFFAPGQAKREILYELSRRPEMYPAGLIMLNHPNACIWTDEAPRVE